MRAERRSEHLALNISPGLKAHLRQLYRRDKHPHCGYVYPAGSFSEYAARLLEECTGYWEKRRAEHLSRYGVEPPPAAASIMTHEDLEFLRANRISGVFLPAEKGGAGRA